MSNILYDKGDIKGFPLLIVDLMLQCQEEQCGHKDVKVFEEGSTSSKDVRGFDWANTPEGYTFWENVIRNRMFKVFFEKYPKKVDDEIASFLDSRNSGQIEDFPKEVLEIMLRRQKDAGNPENLYTFIVDKYADTGRGGFRWSDAPEGYDFWSDVIVNFNYDRFFNKYPKSQHSYSEKIECKVEKWNVLHTAKPIKENYFDFENLFN